MRNLLLNLFIDSSFRSIIEILAGQRNVGSNGSGKIIFLDFFKGFKDDTSESCWWVCCSINLHVLGSWRRWENKAQRGGRSEVFLVGEKRGRRKEWEFGGRKSHWRRLKKWVRKNLRLWLMSGCDCEKRVRVKVVYVVVERGSLGMWNSLEPLDWLWRGGLRFKGVWRTRGFCNGKIESGIVRST